MKPSHPVIIIAKWEFFRFFKWKSELISLFITGLLFLGGLGSKSILDWFRSLESTQVAVINLLDQPVSLNLPDSFELSYHQAGEKSILENKLADEELDGILTVSSLDDAELMVFSEPNWANAIVEQLTILRQQRELNTAQLSPSEFQNILNPVKLNLSYHEDAAEPSSKAQNLLAVYMIILPLIGVFMGFSYFFISITSEKQQRVSEQLISAISPQTWLDGKLVGLSALSFKSMFTTMLYMSIGTIIYFKLSGNWDTLQLGSIKPVALLWASLFIMLALILWCTFMAAIAATISDPNSSSRSSLMMIPILFMSLPFFTLDIPDSLGVSILSIFPLTSMAFMPVRVMLTPVPVWQLILSAVLLLVLIQGLRKAAGTILGLSMMMYGKEPSIKELWRWARIKQ